MDNNINVLKNANANVVENESDYIIKTCSKCGRLFLRTIADDSSEDICSHCKKHGSNLSEGIPRKYHKFWHKRYDEKGELLYKPFFMQLNKEDREFLEKVSKAIGKPKKKILVEALREYAEKDEIKEKLEKNEVEGNE